MFCKAYSSTAQAFCQCWPPYSCVSTTPNVGLTSLFDAANVVPMLDTFLPRSAFETFEDSQHYAKNKLRHGRYFYAAGATGVGANVLLCLYEAYQYAFDTVNNTVLTVGWAANFGCLAIGLAGATLMEKSKERLADSPATFYELQMIERQAIEENRPPAQ